MGINGTGEKESPLAVPVPDGRRPFARFQQCPDLPLPQGDAAARTPWGVTSFTFSMTKSYICPHLFLNTSFLYRGPADLPLAF